MGHSQDEGTSSTDGPVDTRFEALTLTLAWNEQLLNWHYMNFEIRTKTSMHLFTLKVSGAEWISRLQGLGEHDQKRGPSMNS
jgi:hypothetical protein